MHILAFYKEGRWPYANVLPTTKDAFEEALNQTNIIEQQCIEYGLESIQLDEIENFLLNAEKNTTICREDKSSKSPQKSSTLIIDPEKLLPYFKEKYPNVYATVTAEDTDLNVGKVKSADEITATIIDYSHTINKFHASVTITSQNQQFDITKTIPIQVYVYQTEEVDYQRKGLNEHGWSLLPENCTYSTNYDNLVELVNEGGLSRSFLDNWIEGETALMAWW